MSDTKASNHVLSTLQDLIREHMNSQSDTMTSGTYNTLAEYKFGCGVVYGLALAERELLDLNKRLEDD